MLSYRIHCTSCCGEGKESTKEYARDERHFHFVVMVSFSLYWSTDFFPDELILCRDSPLFYMELRYVKLNTWSMTHKMICMFIFHVHGKSSTTTNLDEAIFHVINDNDNIISDVILGGTVCSISLLFFPPITMFTAQKVRKTCTQYVFLNLKSFHNL